MINHIAWQPAVSYQEGDMSHAVANGAMFIPDTLNY